MSKLFKVFALILTSIIQLNCFSKEKEIDFSNANHRVLETVTSFKDTVFTILLEGNSAMGRSTQDYQKALERLSHGIQESIETQGLEETKSILKVTMYLVSLSKRISYLNLDEQSINDLERDLTETINRASPSRTLSQGAAIGISVLGGALGFGVLLVIPSNFKHIVKSSRILFLSIAGGSVSAGGYIGYQAGKYLFVVDFFKYFDLEMQPKFAKVYYEELVDEELNDLTLLD